MPRSPQKVFAKSPRGASRRAARKRTPSPARKSKSPTRQRSKSPRRRTVEPSLETIYASLPATRKSKLANLERILSKDPATQRASPTRGWDAASPARGREREELYAKCGDRCFLRPHNRGYPICPALRTTEGQKDRCAIDCRGVQNAYNRARQHGAKGIENKSKALLNGTCPR